MAEGVSRPANLNDLSEFLVEEIVSHCVLIDDIIDVTDCLVVFDPSSVRDLQLTIFEKLSQLVFLGLRKHVVPVLEEDHFGDKIFALGILLQGLEHRVEDGLAVALVHCVQETSWSEIYVFEFVVRIEPEGVEMGMERDIEFLVIRSADLAVPKGSQGEQQGDEYEMRVFQIHV
jgi:hypothetical protein